MSASSSRVFRVVVLLTSGFTAGVGAYHLLGEAVGMRIGSMKERYEAQLDTAERQKKALTSQVSSLQAQVKRCSVSGGSSSAPVGTEPTPQGASRPFQTPEKTSVPMEPADLTREIDDIAITITRVHLSDDVLTFDFQVLNKAPGDKRMDLLGAGSFGNGSSRLIADGQEYDATSIKVGNEVWEGIVGKRFVSGVPLNGYVAFKGVPRTLKSIAVLELAYSYNNLRPAGVFQFSKLAVNQRGGSLEVLSGMLRQPQPGSANPEVERTKPQQRGFRRSLLSA